MRRIYLWVVLVVTVLSVTNLSTIAQEESPQPSDYWVAEFLIGEIGAILGGSLGLSIYDAYWDHIFRWLYNREPCSGYLKRGFLFCPDDWGETFLLNLGRALGASTGVVLTGLLVGVEGNILGAYLATGLWFAACNRNSCWIIPFVPAFVAIVGYNIGAKMKADKGKSPALGWRLPLFEWRF